MTHVKTDVSDVNLQTVINKYFGINAAVEWYKRTGISSFWNCWDYLIATGMYVMWKNVVFWVIGNLCLFQELFICR